jgi:transposase
MTKHSKILVDYTTKTRNFQLVFPINFEINIPADDLVRLLSNVLEEIDYTELYKAYSRKEKNNTVSPKNLLKLLCMHI